MEEQNYVHGKSKNPAEKLDAVLARNLPDEETAICRRGNQPTRKDADRPRRPTYRLATPGQTVNQGAV